MASSPQTTAQLKAQRAALLARFPSAPSSSSSSTTTMTETRTTTTEDPGQEAAKLAAAREVVRAHIAHLTAYNDAKDVTQSLLGLLADRRGCRVREVMGEYGLAEDD